MRILLAARPHEEIDGLRAARVFHVVKTIAQEFVPILALGHVMNHRSEDCVVVCVPTVLEEKHLPPGFKTRSASLNSFSRAPPAGISCVPNPKQTASQEASGSGTVKWSALEGTIRGLLVGALPGRAHPVPLLQATRLPHSSNPRFETVASGSASDRRNAWRYVPICRSATVISPLTRQIHHPQDVPQRRMPVHAVQTEQRKGQQQHPIAASRSRPGHRHMKQNPIAPSGIQPPRKYFLYFHESRRLSTRRVPNTTWRRPFLRPMRGTSERLSRGPCHRSSSIPKFKFACFSLVRDS